MNGMPRSTQVRGLLAAAAEDERVAALQANHDAALGGVLGEELVDAPLRNGVHRRLLAHVDELGVGRRQGEHRVVGEAVVDDHVGARERVGAVTREQAGVAGAAADQVDGAGVRLVG